MQVVSATCKSKQHENTTGYDHTEFELIKHHRWLIYFTAWFSRNDGSQIVQKDIPHHRVAIENPNEIKLKLKNKFSLCLLTFFFFFLCILYRQEDASKLSWGKKKLTESDINNQQQAKYSVAP